MIMIRPESLSSRLLRVTAASQGKSQVMSMCKSVYYQYSSRFPLSITNHGLFTRTGRASDRSDFLTVDDRHWQLEVSSKVKRENARTEKILAPLPPVLLLASPS